ncbi:MAG: prepilin peptidase [Panacagrimonas sp.]|jgi:leader peptidase (prepilin peptidase)/N-methyltransferase|nr:A24 family peptidase [Panacagrimonas sp.]MCC2657465.1 prepilin peptidase [Panacagrimonas sp.]
MLELLESSPTVLTVSVALLGLCVGSFLNVVAYRLPKMIEQDFRREAREFLRLPSRPERTPVSLSSPPSTCPSCRARIKPWHNLPVVGWLVLRGRCAGCGAGISIQYPVVELLTGVLSVACAWRFGFSPQLAAALVLSWALVALTVTDLRTMYLPDSITLPLLWLGLALSLVPLFADAGSAIVGAIVGYGLLWSIYWAFKLATGREGMGYGDFKLMGALGAWFGWQSLPQIVLLSALVGAIVGISLMVARKAEWSSRIPFGPYIAGAGWIALIWGDQINRTYLGISGIGPAG